MSYRLEINKGNPIDEKIGMMRKSLEKFRLQKTANQEGRVIGVNTLCCLKMINNQHITAFWFVPVINLLEVEPGSIQ